MYDKNFMEALEEENRRRKECGLPPKDFKSLGIEFHDYTKEKKDEDI